MMRYIQGTAVVILIFLSAYTHGQGHRELRQAEDSLILISRSIQETNDDSLRIQRNNDFLSLLKKTISLPGSFQYPFDSIRSMGKIISPDKQFRILNWNLPLTDGTNRYFGIIQFNEGSSGVHPPICLTDVSDSLADASFAILDPDHWYGALYYQIIHTRCGEKDIYTLLGWDALNAGITRKVIEILKFEQNGRAIFGATLFPNYGDGKNARIIFNFSSSSNMILHYEEQMLTTQKTWNSRKRVFESKSVKTNMIVSDRLIPLDPSFEGSYQYYIPAGDIYDGFIFKDCHWNFLEKVDARNN